MFRTKQIHPTSRPRTRKSLALALSAALLGFVAIGSTAAPAQAAAGPELLTGSNCFDQDQYFGELFDQTIGWYPGWTNIERQRKAIVCLMNYARTRNNQLMGTHLTPLSACPQDATLPCDSGTVLGRLTHQQLANLTTAAQWKAMEVDYMCTTATGGIPHYACGRAANYWLDWWKANNPGVGYTAWAENLAPGYTRGNLVTPRIIVERWLNEIPDGNGLQSHRDAILSATYHYVGVGVTPAANGTIASGSPYNWGTFRQVISADFVN